MNYVSMQVNARAGAQALPRAAGASRVAALSTAVRRQLAQGLPAASLRSAAMAAASARQQLTVRCSVVLHVCSRRESAAVGREAGLRNTAVAQVDPHKQQRPLCRYSQGRLPLATALAVDCEASHAAPTCWLLTLQGRRHGGGGPAADAPRRQAAGPHGAGGPARVAEVLRLAHGGAQRPQRLRRGAAGRGVRRGSSLPCCRPLMRLVLASQCPQH